MKCDLWLGMDRKAALVTQLITLSRIQTTLLLVFVTQLMVTLTTTAMELAHALCPVIHMVLARVLVTIPGTE